MSASTMPASAATSSAVGGMATFGLSDEHLHMRETLRRFVDKEIRPIAIRAEEDKTFPREVLGLLAERKLLGLKFPEAFGGQGLDILAECLFIEELTRAAAGLSASVFAHSHLALAPILYFGSDELRERYAAPALRGELVAAFALTEPDAGSDVKGIRTRARRNGDGYVLNGSKVFITNGTIADFLLLAAYTDPSLGSRGISVFVVPTDTAGIERRALHKLGNWSADTAEVFLNDVVVPADHLVGPAEGGFTQLMRTLTEGRIIVSTRGLAIAERAYEQALGYARERMAFGRPIGSNQAISHRLARLSIEIDAARLLIYRTAHLYMAGQDCAIEASKAKYFASTLAQRATTEALHIHGGWGYMHEYEVERLYRDAPEAMIGEGTAEIQLRTIAKSLGLVE